MSLEPPNAPESLALPETCLPSWGVADLPEPPGLSWGHWTRFIGPGLVMMGYQIGGGEWLFGPEITARYGGGLLWIATVAIVLQVFYNMECGRYALYSGETVFTGFMRCRPGPAFWIGLVMLLNVSSLIPGLSTHGAAMVAALWLDRPPGEADRWLVSWLSYALLLVVALPVLVGGKVYNTLQAVMIVKVLVVLGFCLAVGLICVRPSNWLNVFGGFVRFGTVPTAAPGGGETLVNLFTHRWNEGAWPVLALGNIALVGAFAGYAGGGGLSNAGYSSYVRDKGWGMGKIVGAIPSAVGGRDIRLSHIGKVFPPDAENLRRWRGWWRHLKADQLIVWVPGCVMGMALPALLSIEFVPYSKLGHAGLEWSQSLMTADGLRHAPRFGPTVAGLLWLSAVVVGLMVVLPTQLSIVDEFSRRWTDIFWSGSPRIRDRMAGGEVWRLYYGILACYLLWSVVIAYLFNTYGTPKLMTVVIANLNNVSIGLTSVQLWWVNRRLLPSQIRPKWHSQAGLLLCGAFYLGLAGLIFWARVWPLLAGG